MDDTPFWSARKLAAAIRRRELSAAELLDLYLARIERYNPAINAVIGLAVDAARAAADAADHALARGDALGPLHGVPMTVKEAFAGLGLPTTWGVPEFRDNRPARPALALERLAAAGAVIFGKTNVPLWLADWQSYNAIYGLTSNPWDSTRSPGGSSGGSAAALAAGLTGLELGSDIGGSIRVPAHFCGVYGHKPTYGLCAVTGHALGDWAAPPDIAVIGPMGRSADDLLLGLEAIIGPDYADGPGARLSLAAAPRRSFAEYRIAVMLEDEHYPVDREVQDQIQALVDFLAQRKAVIRDARPSFDTEESYGIFLSLLYAALSQAQTPAEYAQNLEQAKALPAGDQGFRAHYLRGSTLAHKDWLHVNARRAQLRRRWAEFFKDYDLLLCPVLACAAFPHDHRPWPERHVAISGTERPTAELSFWPGLSGVAYLPATAAPIGFTRSGLPVGVQIVGPHLGDLACIAFAQLIEREYHAFSAPPGFR
jgi:amidase